MLIDYSLNAPPFLALLGKWFLFWGAGVRLCIAGIRQLVQPRFTAEEIFGFTGEDAVKVVRELGDEPNVNVRLAELGELAAATAA